MTRPAPARTSDRFSCLDVANKTGLQFHRKSGSERIYRCPRHDDQHPSLGINPDKDTWMCGPCTAKGTAWDLLAFVGRADPGDRQAMHDLRVKYGLLSGYGTQSPPVRKILASYSYTDEHGKVLFQVVRFDPKEFRQRQPDEKGEWTWNTNGIRRVLYRLPELLRGVDVFVVEGEKDVDALCKLGLTATSNPGGAGKWRDEYTASFQAHQHVVIIPDNDDPGRKHAHQVAAALSGKVTSLKILELRGLPEKGDVSDWLAGKDCATAGEELAKLAEAAPEWKPESSAIAESVFLPPAHWKRLDVAFVRKWQCAPLRVIVDGILALANFVFVAAQSQTGKTLLALYLARRILQGGQLFGRYTVTPVERVLYLLLEDPDRRAQARILDTDHEFPEPLAPERFVIHVAPSFTLTDPKMFGWLEHVIASERREVVFLDTYQKSTPGISSFDDEQQGEILHKLANLTRLLNTTLIVMDHFRKDNAGKGRRREITIDDIKGTGGKAQNADCVILMERTPDRNQIKFQSFSKDFDTPIKILLNVAPRGSTEPKFTYAGDLEELGSTATAKRDANRAKILASFKPAERLSTSEVAKRSGLTDGTVRRHLNALVREERMDSAGEGKARRYWPIGESAQQSAQENG